MVKKYTKHEFREAEDSKGPWHDVDLSPLEKEIKKVTKEDIKLQILQEKHNGSSVFVKLGSDKNLASKAGILSAVIDTLYVQTFNSTIKLDHDGMKWWMQMDFRWQHNKIAGRGSNGATFLEAWYDFNTEKWTFKSE